VNIRNVIAGNQLAGRSVGQMMPLPFERQARRIAWHRVGSPTRIIQILNAAIEARVPIGYEDETGFHYGTDTRDWSFTI